jgi:hypothetical protein
MLLTELNNIDPEKDVVRLGTAPILLNNYWKIQNN